MRVTRPLLSSSLSCHPADKCESHDRCYLPLSCHPADQCESHDRCYLPLSCHPADKCESHDRCYLPLSSLGVMSRMKRIDVPLRLISIECALLICALFLPSFFRSYNTIRILRDVLISLTVQHNVALVHLVSRGIPIIIASSQDEISIAAASLYQQVIQMICKRPTGAASA